MLDIGVLTALIGVADPAWHEAEVEQPGRTVVLVDGSRSMGIESNGQSRGDVAMRASSLGDDVDVFAFGSRSPGRRVDDAGTDIGGALEAVADRYLGQQPAASLLTDGIDRGGLRSDGAGSIAGRVPELPGPLTVVQVGEALGGVITPTDIRTVASPSSERSRSRPSWGQPGHELPVTSVARAPSDTQRVTRCRRTCGGPLRGHPERGGTFRGGEYSGRGADAIPGNNSHSRHSVVRDRTRVLQVCGSPSYDQKFLRLFLKEDLASTRELHPADSR